MIHWQNQTENYETSLDMFQPDLGERVETLQNSLKSKTEELEQAKKRITILGTKIGRLEKENLDLVKKIKKHSLEKKKGCIIC